MEFYNPNVIGKQTTPEGHVGPNASIVLPFTRIGYWFPDGKILTFLTGEIPQRGSRIVNGTWKPPVFRKDASDCPVAV